MTPAVSSATWSRSTSTADRPNSKRRRRSSTSPTPPRASFAPVQSAPTTSPRCWALTRQRSPIEPRVVQYGSPVVLAADNLLALSDRGAGVPLRELALVGLTAATITYFCTGWVRVLATRSGAVAYPRERDVHLQPTPRMGGL